jgi:hypothetical protein
MVLPMFVKNEYRAVAQAGPVKAKSHSCVMWRGSRTKNEMLSVALLSQALLPGYCSIHHCNTIIQNI